MWHLRRSAGHGWAAQRTGRPVRAPRLHTQHHDLRGVRDERYEAPPAPGRSGCSRRGHRAWRGRGVWRDEPAAGAEAGRSWSSTRSASSATTSWSSSTSSRPASRSSCARPRSSASTGRKLVRYLATGKGAGDVVALEEGIINEFKINPANWVDLSPLRRRQERASTCPGSTSSARPPTASSSACRPTWAASRSATAGPVRGGRPADRARSGRQRCGRLGRVHRRPARSTAGQTGKGLLDSVTTAASAIIFQVGGDSFYDKDSALHQRVTPTKEENLVAANSPAVKAAWDTALEDGRRQHHRQGRAPGRPSGALASRTAPSRRPSARPG